MGKKELRLIDANVLKTRAREVLNDGTPTTISLLKIFDSIVDSVKPLNYIDQVTVDFSDLTEEQRSELCTAFSKSVTHVIAYNDFENVERPKGHWCKTGQSFVNPSKFRNYCCSNCLCELDEHIRTEPNFCQNCGADMRGGR